MHDINCAICNGTGKRPAYTATELQAEFPRGFENAHEKFLQWEWDSFANERISELIISAANFALFGDSSSEYMPVGMKPSPIETREWDAQHGHLTLKSSTIDVLELLKADTSMPALKILDMLKAIPGDVELPEATIAFNNDTGTCDVGHRDDTREWINGAWKVTPYMPELSSALTDYCEALTESVYYSAQKAMRAQYKYIESVEYFLEACEANKYQFTANGELL